MLLVFKKLIFATMSKIAKFGKKTQGILGVYGKKKSKNNIQDVGLLAKCGCIMCTIIVYRRTADILVCSICQKLANCTFISKSRVTTSTF
jgi:hypothetical protein